MLFSSYKMKLNEKKELPTGKFGNKMKKMLLVKKSEMKMK